MTTPAPEELFPPRPGGMVDTARKKMAADEAQAAAIPEPAPRTPKREVPVADQGTELARARTFSISTGNNNPIVELLGQDTQRRNAVILSVEQPVVISFSQQAAEDPRNAAWVATNSANGFVLPSGVPITVSSQSNIYASATGTVATSVSVMAFSYRED